MTEREQPITEIICESVKIEQEQDEMAHELGNTEIIDFMFGYDRDEARQELQSARESARSIGYRL